MITQPVIRMVSKSDKGVPCCAAAARLSTTATPACSLIESRTDADKDRRLVLKVLSSGHQSLIEHCQMTFSLDGVSVFAEQFLIESRLCAFTVKSRRYVDFENAGYYRPVMDEKHLALYEKAMEDRFSDYARLISLGIPKEDARFVLPYCFYSSLYVSGNARELALLIGHMLYGRGRHFPELYSIGQQMSIPFEETFPGVLQALSARFDHLMPSPVSRDIAPCQQAHGESQLLSCPSNGPELLESALAFSGRSAENALASLVKDARPRELEFLNYAFLLKDVSLACVTHIARHRIQSPLFGHTLSALNRQRYILPATVSKNPDALAVYKNAFESQNKTALLLTEGGLDSSSLCYLALSGLTVDVMLSMNARELLHFLKLRTCTRAQWEIRSLAGQMLSQLRQSYPALFSLYGPSCAVTGRCPEGALSCGRVPVQN